MRYTIFESPLGFVLVSLTHNGICFLSMGDKKSILENAFKQRFGQAQKNDHDPTMNRYVRKLQEYLSGQKSWPVLSYDVQATDFQKRVWDWLRKIPTGKTYQYSEVARALGIPTAARAVARACASNPIALVIPCHRIVPKSGGVGGFRWGSPRKQKLLQLEKIRR